MIGYKFLAQLMTLRSRIHGEAHRACRADDYTTGMSDVFAYADREIWRRVSLDVFRDVGSVARAETKRLVRNEM